MASPGADTFLHLLDEDPVQAEKKYVQLRNKLVFFFRHNGFRDAEDLADETVLRAIRRIREGVEAYAGFAAFCHGIAKFIVKEERRRAPEQDLPEELPNTQSNSPHNLTRTETIIFTEQITSKLTYSERDLLTQYYSEDREKLAESEGISPNSLRIRVFRIRQKLQDKDPDPPK